VILLRFSILLFVTMGCLAAETAPAPASGVSAGLRQAYQDRARREAEAWTKKLDEANQGLAKQVEKGAGSVAAPLLQALAERKDTCGNYRELLRVADKYSQWACEAKLPGEFDVPDSVMNVHRWEALRPLLIPIVTEPNLRVAGSCERQRHLAAKTAGHAPFGWDDPKGDDPAWRDAPNHEIYDFLTLLAWLTPGPANTETADQNWVRGETRSDFAHKWLNSGAGRREFLHGEYSYDPLGRPPENELPALPDRVKSMVQRLDWAPGETDLPGFAQRKDTILLDLLELITHGQAANSEACDWFVCGARSFPYFTAFEIKTLDHDRIAAYDERRDRSVKVAFETLKKQPSGAATFDLLKPSVFWYQLETASPNGEWTAACQGWSSWVDPNMPATPAAPPAQPRDTGPSPEPRSGLQLGADSAWRAICLWAVGVWKESGLAAPSAVSVENRTSWQFAFGADELRAALAGAGHGPRCAVAVLDVKPGESVCVGVFADGRLLKSETFTIAGEWYPWFAAPRWPTPLDYPLLGVCCFLLVGIVSLRRRSLMEWRGYVFSDSLGRMLSAHRAAMAFVALGLALGLVALVAGPRPIGSPPLGGTIEMDLANHHSLPAGERELAMEACRKIYGLGFGGPAEKKIAGGWWSRFFHALRAIVQPGLEKTRPQAHGERLYRLVLSSWNSQTSEVHGRVRQEDEEAFSHLLDSLKLDGQEPDLPHSLARPESTDTILSFIASTGDYGGVTPPSFQPRKSLSPVMIFYLPSPARDSAGDRLLGATACLERLRPYGNIFGERFDPEKLVVSESPENLDDRRNRLFGSGTGDKKAIEEISDAAEAILKPSSPEISRPSQLSATSLRLPPWRGVWTASIGLLVAIAFMMLIWHHRPDLPDSGLWLPQSIGLFLAALLLAGSASAMVATVEPRVWTYDVPLLAAPHEAFCVFGVAPVVVALVIAVNFHREYRARFTGGFWRSAWPDRCTFPLAVITSWRSAFLIGVSLLPFGCAWMLWISAPVRTVAPPWLASGLLPHSYPACMASGILLWLLGAALLLRAPTS